MCTVRIWLLVEALENVGGAKELGKSVQTWKTKPLLLHLLPAICNKQKNSLSVITQYLPVSDCLILLVVKSKSCLC